MSLANSGVSSPVELSGAIRWIPSSWRKLLSTESRTPSETVVSWYEPRTTVTDEPSCDELSLKRAFPKSSMPNLSWRAFQLRQIIRSVACITPATAYGIQAKSRVSNVIPYFLCKGRTGPIRAWSRKWSVQYQRRRMMRTDLKAILSTINNAPGL